MWNYLRKSPSAFFFSVLVHGILIILLMVSLDWNLKSKSGASTQQVVQAVVLDELKVQEEIKRLQQSERRKQQLAEREQRIFQATKDMGSSGGGETGRGRGRIILDNGMPRAEYIRQEFAKGRKRGEIAKELGIAYQIVFQATKGAKQVEAPVEAEGEAQVVNESTEIEFEDSDELPE